MSRRCGTATALQSMSGVGIRASTARSIGAAPDLEPDRVQLLAFGVVQGEEPPTRPWAPQTIIGYRIAVETPMRLHAHARRFETHALPIVRNVRVDRNDL